MPRTESDAELLRAFVALEIEEESLLSSIESFQRELESTGADLKLVPRQNIHFTVKFLGEISEQQAAEVDRRLRELTLQSLSVTLAGAGAFPSLSRPRVVWVGVVGEGGAELRELAGRVIAALKGLGEDDRRGFQPHITVARVRSGRGTEALAYLLRQNQTRTFGPTELRELKFKSSVLTPDGPIYSDEGVYKLA